MCFFLAQKQIEPKKITRIALSNSKKKKEGEKKSNSNLETKTNVHFHTWHLQSIVHSDPSPTRP
jgi:predicted metalloenzyme YecM